MTGFELRISGARIDHSTQLSHNQYELTFKAAIYVSPQQCR